jgi:hypothetical protein
MSIATFIIMAFDKNIKVPLSSTEQRYDPVNPHVYRGFTGSYLCSVELSGTFIFLSNAIIINVAMLIV